MVIDVSLPQSSTAVTKACPGFNVIGHLSSSSGLGNTVRLYIRMLQQLGYDVVGIDIDYDKGVERQPVEGLKVVTSVDQLPYQHSLVIVSIQLLPSLWLRRLPQLLAPGRTNVGLIFWELPRVPQAWWPSLALFDAILTCSPFVRHAIETAVPDVPTLHSEHPLMISSPHENSETVRNRLNIPRNAFVCCMSFDLRSDYSRKNPGASIHAFLRAFPTEPDVRLVIKTNGEPDRVAMSSHIKNLIALIRSDKRIILITETLPYDAVLAIYNAADVFISLHRSEGLGLGPMEAMLFGKLVIATGYSGNMAYMTDLNSMPIPYRLVEPKQTSWQFKRAFSGATSGWAEVDLEQAVFALKAARNNPQFRHVLASRGANEMQEKQGGAWNGHYLPQLIKYLNTTDRVPLRKALIRQVRQMEIKDPTLRKLNFGMLLDLVRLKVERAFKEFRVLAD